MKLVKCYIGDTEFFKIYLGSFLIFDFTKLPLEDYLLEGNSPVAIDYAIQKLTEG